MWLDTKVNGEIRSLNMDFQKQLRLERAGKDSIAWQLKLGTGSFGVIVGIYENFDDALAMYENICDALKNGMHYFKLRDDDTYSADNQC